MKLTGAFHSITIGDRVLFVMAAERCSLAQARAEIVYWRGIFGDGVRYEMVDTDADTATAAVACAIMDIAEDGIGVVPQQLVARGFDPEQVARLWAPAMDLVRANQPARGERAPLNDAGLPPAEPENNIVPFRPRPLHPRKSRA